MPRAEPAWTAPTLPSGSSRPSRHRDSARGAASGRRADELLARAGLDERKSEIDRHDLAQSVDHLRAYGAVVLEVAQERPDRGNVPACDAARVALDLAHPRL